jgi:hypothetical protein
MSARTITLLAAILGMVSTLAACLTDPSSVVHLSAAQGLLVSALGGGAYALARSFQKLKAGSPLKTLLATSEAKGAVIVYLSSILTAVIGIVPPQYAVLASTVVTLLVGAARMFVGPTSGGTGPFAAALVLFGVLSFGGVAHAQGVDGGVDAGTWITLSAEIPPGLYTPDASVPVLAAPVPIPVPPPVAPTTPTKAAIPSEAAPQIGFTVGNLTTCQIATAVGLQLNLKTNTWKKAVALEGFGCTYRGWEQAIGVAAYLGYSVAIGEPNGYQGTLLFSYADWVAAGPGVVMFKDPGDPSGQAWIMQGTLTLVLNYNSGASVDKFIKALQVKSVK